VTVPVRAGKARDDIDVLSARLSDLESACDERETEIAKATSDLAEFRIRYRRDVGSLHEELEELERAIAEAELGEFAKRLEAEGAEEAASVAAPPSDSAPRLTSDAVRKLFRDVAKMIHPDLAADDRTRDRRHALMIEANRAYALGDEERLRMILDTWEKSPESVQGDGQDAARLRLERRIAQIEEQLVVRARELADLQESPLWTLKVMVDHAEARGKDLIADQVRRLKRDITAARNRLDAMTS
jgi:hypothetical protein